MRGRGGWTGGGGLNGRQQLPQRTGEGGREVAEVGVGGSKGGSNYLNRRVRGLGGWLRAEGGLA